MIEKLVTLDDFFEFRQSYDILDARSESEFAQSHVPGAVNIPVLNDQERIIVGTIYKQEGSEQAVLKGFELVGPRFHEIQKKAIELFPEKKVLLYCWRGGMRSQIMSWLLGMMGFEVFRLKGGYKTYRTFTFETVRKPYPFIVLGGKTGSAKTRLLHALKAEGEQVIDLEGLANHKGSSFGGIGQYKQPSVEQFENLLAEELLNCDPTKPIWVEDESRRIGSIILPDPLYFHLGESAIIVISRTLEERVKHIKQEYASLPKEELNKAVSRLSRKLGGLRTAEALEDIKMDRYESWIRNMLLYYDKAYDFDLKKRHLTNRIDLSLEGVDLDTAHHRLLNLKTDIINGNIRNKADTME
jgi:tRNA 2-selenouridine synthase